MPNALVTGASKGIGKAICEILLANNWSVYGISRSNPQISDNNFQWINFDLMNFVDYDTILEQLPAQIDLLIINAGIAYAVNIDQLLPLDIDKQLGINTKSPILLTQKLLPRLTGKIINISSEMVNGTTTNLALYAASKAATATFIKSIASERVQAANLYLGATDSPLSKALNLPANNLITVQTVVEVVMELATAPEIQDKTLSSNL